jgi:hypothetical protein
MGDSGDGEESGDDADASSKSAPKPKSTLGKRKAEFSSRKPKRGCLYIRALFGDELVIDRDATGGPRIEVEYENETEVVPRTRVAAGW